MTSKETSLEIKQSVLACETTKTVCFILLAVTWLQFPSRDQEGGKNWHSVSTAALKSNHCIKERMSAVNQREASGTFLKLSSTKLHVDFSSAVVQSAHCSSMAHSHTSTREESIVSSLFQRQYASLG